MATFSQQEKGNKQSKKVSSIYKVVVLKLLNKQQECYAKSLVATRVVLFGSMLQPKIHADSDIDLAVWNLTKSDYFQAVGKLQGLSEFLIDLIEADNASDYIVEAIAQGMEL